MKFLPSAALSAVTLLTGAVFAASPADTLPITDKDQCHSCEMWIAKYPGPKGEVVTKSGAVYKFCSAKCMLCTIKKQVDNPAIDGIFVHDMSKTDWEHPADDAFMDARKAWFVGGSSRKATMGKSFAPFPTKQAAEAFQKQYGGSIYTFDELTPEILGCRTPRKPFVPMK